MSDMEKFKKNKKELLRHIKKLNTKFEYLSEMYSIPINSKFIEQIMENDIDDAIDVIGYRFSKLQDRLGRTIKLYLDIQGENIENLAMMDILHIARSYKIEIDDQFWNDLKKLKNSVLYEYDDDYEKIANTINQIYLKVRKLTTIIDIIAGRVNK